MRCVMQSSPARYGLLRYMTGRLGLDVVLSNHLRPDHCGIEEDLQGGDFFTGKTPPVPGGGGTADSL